MSVLNFFKQQDYFGSTFQMSIGGGQRTKTMLGFILSLLSAAVIIFASTKFMTDFFNTSRPSVLLKDITNEEYSNISLNKDNLNYFFTIRGTSGFIKPEDASKYFNFTVYYEKLDMPEVAGSAKFKITSDIRSVRRCTELSWFQEKKQFIDPAIKSIVEVYGICADDEPAEHLLYNGSDPPYGHLELQFRKCILGANCISGPELDSTEIYFGTFEHIFSAKQISEPLYVLGSIKRRITVKQQEKKEYRYFANDVKVSTDTGLFLPSFTERSGFQLGTEKYDQRKLYPSDLAYVQILIYTSSRHIGYTRVYYKFLQLLADIGGIIQIIAFTITVLYSEFNSYVQNKNLICYALLQKKPATAIQLSDKDYSAAKPGMTPCAGSPVGIKSPQGNKRITGIEYPISSKEPETPNCQPDLRKQPFTKYAEKVKDRKLFNTDDFRFRDVVMMNLINSRLINSQNETMKKKAAFYALCQEQLAKLRDVYRMTGLLNEMTILQDIMVPEEAKSLTHYAALEFSTRMAEESRVDMSYREAIKRLLTEESTSRVQSELTDYMLSRVKAFEIRFNGDARNHLRDIKREVRRSPRNISKNL